MPRYLTIFTADVVRPPTQEEMQTMGAYMGQQAAKGRFILGGGLKRRDADGLQVRRKGDSYTVQDGGAAWAAGTGFAILEAPSREALIADVKEFLGIAGDGVSEIIEISSPPPQ